jgi:hypothetical protein
MGESDTGEGEGGGVSEQGSDDRQSTQFHYHLELTPAQLKITHTALHSLRDDFGRDQPEVLRTIHEVLEKLPDEHAIRAIQLDREIERQLTTGDEPGNEPPTAA